MGEIIQLVEGGGEGVCSTVPSAQLLWGIHDTLVHHTRMCVLLRVCHTFFSRYKYSTTTKINIYTIYIAHPVRFFSSVKGDAATITVNVVSMHLCS